MTHISSIIHHNVKHAPIKRNINGGTKFNIEVTTIKVDLNIVERRREIVNSLHTFFIRISVLAPVLKVSYNNAIFNCESFLKVYKRKMEFKSINYDLKNNVSSHPQNSSEESANIQEESKKYISSYF